MVLLFGKELASFAPLDEVFSVSHGRGPVESRSVCLADQVSGCRVAATFAAVSAKSWRPSDRKMHFIKTPVEVAFLYRSVPITT
jgi:hypothetical protein